MVGVVGWLGHRNLRPQQEKERKKKRKETKHTHTAMEQKERRKEATGDSHRHLVVKVAHACGERGDDFGHLVRLLRNLFGKR